MSLLLRVEASDGLDRPSQSVQYRIGEGITGRVVETGKPIVVPRVSREPAMLNRAARRAESDDQELSFVCVPILLNRRAVGALGVDLRYKAERDFDSSVKFMGVVASMLAQAVKIQRLVEEDKRRLVDENEHLRQELRDKSLQLAAGEETLRQGQLRRAARQPHRSRVVRPREGRVHGRRPA